MADYEVIREDGMNIQIKQIDGDFSVCKVTDYSQVNLDAQYCFLGKTDEGNSLVCLTEDVSTYNTDYILTKCDNYDKALQVLADAGYMQPRNEVDHA